MTDIYKHHMLSLICVYGSIRFVWNLTLPFLVLKRSTVASCPVARWTNLDVYGRSKCTGDWTSRYITLGTSALQCTQWHHRSWSWLRCCHGGQTVRGCWRPLGHIDTPAVDFGPLSWVLQTEHATRLKASYLLLWLPGDKPEELNMNPWHLAGLSEVGEKDDSRRFFSEPPTPHPQSFLIFSVVLHTAFWELEELNECMTITNSAVVWYGNGPGCTLCLDFKYYCKNILVPLQSAVTVTLSSTDPPLTHTHTYANLRPSQCWHKFQRYKQKRSLKSTEREGERVKEREWKNKRAWERQKVRETQIEN